MRKLICLLLALSLVLGCTTVAFAEALREDPKAKSKIPVRFDKSDYAVEDFTGVEVGSLPTTITANSPDIYTEEYEVLPGYKKNCLVINDKTTDNTYSGITAYYNFGSRTGKLEVTVRYKFIPTATDWGSFIFGFYSAKGMFSRTVVASANGYTHFNYGGPDSTAIENARMAHDTWYTLTYVINFDGENAQYMDAKLVNEGTKAFTIKTGATWYEGVGHADMYRLMLQSSMYGGKYVFDYIRVRKAPEGADLEEVDPYADIKKGVEQIKIPAPVNGAVEGRVNVTYNGKYKYTTLAPYIAENGSAMISAKNLADMFGLGYIRKGTEFTVTAGDTKLVFTADSDTVTVGKKSQTLKDKTASAGNQLYVPAEVICEAVGLQCTYDEATKTIVITTAATEEGGDK